uniref:Chromosome partition protein Smc n=1 Tax=Candidatus Methanophagaceae archaeon ANME-1 ERB6 TaxID=2759912 RepID=A0A7G9YYA1_9EURY|nr:chromosome partition protein Smc [Methanosarcinales archaeon ANME-1 ERB6]
MEKGEDTVNRIVIGIGGQGGIIVNNILRMLKFKAGKAPKNEEFLIIDTDQASANACTEVEERKKIILSRPDTILMKNTNRWLPDPYLSAAGAGCGQHRIYGRAMYNVHRERIFSAIGSAASELRNRTGGKDFFILMVCAFGGGTGSSMLLDVAIDIRDWISKQFGSEPVMFGIGILPSSKESVLPTGNALGTMKELHFLMSHTEDIIIDDKNYSNPFKLFFLLGRDLQGQNRDEELERAIPRFLLDLGFLPGGTVETKGKWLDLNDLQNRARGYENRFDSLGYYECVFPTEKLFLYYDIEDEIPVVRQRLVEIEAKISDIRGKIDSQRGELERFEGRIKDVQREINSYESAAGMFSHVNAAATTDAKAKLDRARKKLSGLKEEVFDLEIRASDAEEEKRLAERNLERLEALKNKLFREITSPLNTRSYHQIELSEEEIRSLKRSREDLKNLSFFEIMKNLDREEEYFRWTHSPINEGDVIFNPMVNYRHSIGNAMTSKYIDVLHDYGFLTLDAQGNVVNEEEKFGHFIAVLSTRADNFDDARLGGGAFKSMVTERFTKDADVLKLDTPARAHSFAMYTLMIGVQPWAPGPGLPPRLRELEWLEKAYSASDFSKLPRHHSLFYGTPKPFSLITGIPYTPGAEEKNRDMVTNYWRDYEIIEPEAIWNNVPVVLAQCLKMFDDLLTGLDMAEDIKNVRVPESYSIANLTMLVHGFENASKSMEKVKRWTKEAERGFVLLKNELDELIFKLKGMERAPAEDKAEKMLRMIDDSSRNMEILLDRIEDLSNRFSDDIKSVIEEAMVFIGKIPSEETTSSVIRHITKAESEISKLREDSMKAAKGIKEMGGPLAMVLSSLKELKKITEAGESEAETEGGEGRKEKSKSVELPDLSLSIGRGEGGE